MNKLINVLFLFLFYLHVALSHNLKWIVEVKHGGSKTAHRIAKKYNLKVRGLAGKVHNLYVLEERGDGKSRRKRSLLPYDDKASEDSITDDMYSKIVTDLMLHEKELSLVEPQVELRRVKRGFVRENCCNEFNDPEFPNQWFFKNDHGLDTNIYGAWKQGYTGKGVVVTILDDGIEHTHDDLIDNYDESASYDFNSNDMDPSPRILMDGDVENENLHGTRCAGQVAASANNSKCGVGAAFEASIGGVRMLDGRVTDEIECDSISFNRDHIDIYSASWGPEDDGKTIDGPKTCTKRALKDGVKKGRQGKGSIFVWASGNGGRHMDDCNLDGYVSSIYTIAISAISSSGLSPWYSESCSCTLASVYSSGFTTDEHIVTTDVLNKCTNEHTGTSAAAPLAAGILALVLQANPNLTWRDVQHIIVQGANRVSNDRADKWNKNGAGFEFHHKLGFGVLDATKMVNLAKNWTLVGSHRKCHALKLMNHTKIIPPQKILTIKTSVTEENCNEATTGVYGKKHLSKLEHVQLTLTMSTTSRGDIMLRLTSPSGTVSKILSMRPEDNTSNKLGFKNQIFMTTNFWGENPYGKWGLQIVNGVPRQSSPQPHTRIRKMKLTFWGTGDEEVHETTTGNDFEDAEGNDEDSDGDFSNDSRELHTDAEEGSEIAVTKER